MNKILITGITGFIGSHIAENLVKKNFKVIGLKRQYSNCWRCEGFMDKIIWVNIDDEKNYKEILISYGIDYLIHCAWIGVESGERDSWNLQAQNFNFLTELLEVSRIASVKKVIILGSQSEYGNFEENISESHLPRPENAYASVKLACLELTKHFAKINNLEWIWIRLFSLFGEKEGNSWLIPSVINAIINNERLDLTLGEQKYSYLYIKDFALIISSLIEKNIESGIYNVSSDSAFSIKEIIKKIKNKINPFFELKFGTLDYRKNQSMYIKGDTSKLEKQIGNLTFTNFDLALQNTINYYKNKNSIESI